MMPVAPTPKKSSSFTIESLVGKDCSSNNNKSSNNNDNNDNNDNNSSSSRSKSSPSDPRGGSTSPRGANSSSPGAGGVIATTPRSARDGAFIGGLHPHHHSSFHPVTPSSLANGSGTKTFFPEVGGLPFPLDSIPPHFHGHLNGHLGIPAAHTSPHVSLGGPGGGLPPPHHHHQHGLPSTLHPFFLGANRDAFPFYPWLVSRNGGFLHHRFTGPDAGLLLQPFRKPKRIRTAFSPSQLLRLEHAFEKNHYVVGQERKELAVNLSLTETQVKVWFQNRRTKYKRLKAEEAETRGGKEATDDTEADHVMLDDSRDEEEDMEDMIEAEEEEEEEEEELERRRDIDSEGQIRVVSPSDAGMVSASSTTQITDATRKASHHLNRWRVETNLV